MKYQSQIEPLKNQLLTAQNVLIALPATTTVDKLAAGLALLLSLKQSGKQVDIATEDTLRVAHTNLFGIGEVKNQISSGAANGNQFVLTLEGVVDESGNVNSEKLDYYQEGQNLQLIFTIPQGKKFEPKQITTNYQGGSSNTYQMIFVLGVDNLQELGSLFMQNQSIFTPAQLVNIDNSQTNAQYGATNIVDTNASSVCEMIAQILPDLGLTMQEDIATNLLTGIYNATQNMSINVKPDTFVSASTAMQAGGKIPQENMANQGFVNQPQNYVQPQQMGVPNSNPVVSQDQTQQQSIPVVMEPASQPQQPAPPVQNEVIAPSAPQQEPVLTPQQQLQNLQQNNPGFNLGQVFNLPYDPVTGQAPTATPTQNQPIPSAEERPQGERVTSGNPEVDNPAPDWLVPKIYKSGG
jgi:hypothetical protein